MKKGILFVVLIFCCVLTPHAVTHATMSLAMSLEELVHEGSYIALVTAMRSEAKWDEHGRIVTDATVRVDETMKGSLRVGDQVAVRSLGGAIGDLGMTVAGEAHISVGERAILFARENTPGERVFQTIGMSQGLMPVVIESGKEMVQPGGGGQALVQRSQSGQLVQAPPALRTAQALREVISEIRRIVDETRVP